jgi:predicted RNase H-like HicB family nuclease
MTRYCVIYEGDDTDGWSAFSPDLPGCYAAGATRPEVEELMKEAIVGYLEFLRDENMPVPKPTSFLGYIAA